VKLRVDEVITLSGRKTTREVLERPATVSVLALDAGGNILLVEQYRYAVDRTSLEIPAGVVDKGETLEEAARRELREETGYDCGRLEKLVSYFPAIGYATEEMTVFVAKDLQPAPLKGDEEEIHLVRMPFQDVYRSIVAGAPLFTDAKSTIAVLLAKARGLI